MEIKIRESLQKTIQRFINPPKAIDYWAAESLYRLLRLAGDAPHVAFDDFWRGLREGAYNAGGAERATATASIDDVLWEVGGRMRDASDAEEQAASAYYTADRVAWGDDFWLPDCVADEGVAYSCYLSAAEEADVAYTEFEATIQAEYAARSEYRLLCVAKLAAIIAPVAI